MQNREMIARLLKWFRGDQPTGGSVSAKPATIGFQLVHGIPDLPPSAADDDPLRDVPRYPPFDEGIPVTPIDRVLASQAELIDRIYRTAGASREEFADQYLPAITNLARYVHLLPASDVHNHSGAGGLLCFALEIGLYSLQHANAAVFPVGGGVERRYVMQPKWNLATFLAGICSQLYRTSVKMVVVTKEQEQWQPLLEPIYDWALQSGTDRYFIRWLEERNAAGAQASSAYIVNHIVPPEVMQYLTSDNNIVLPAMSGAISGGMAGDNPISKIVNPITSRVTVMDQDRSARHYGHMLVGAHLEPHLLDAMLRMVRNGTWTWNNPKAVIWIGTDGVFIDWGQASRDVVKLLRKDGYVGIPQDPDTLAEMLAAAQIFEQTRHGGKYWPIMPSEVSQVIDTAVKVRHPDHVFPAGFDLEAHVQGAMLVASEKPVTSKDRGSRLPPSAMSTNVGSQPAVETPNASLSSPDHPVEKDPCQDAAHRRGGEAYTVPSHQELDGDFVMDGESGEILGQEPPLHLQVSTGTPSTTGPNSNSRTADAGKASTANPQPIDSKPTKGLRSGGKPEPSGSDRLLGMLKPENARLMQDIMGAISKKRLTGIVKTLPNGFGISHEELIAHGRPPADFMDELHSRKWVWIDPTKPMKMMHRIEVAPETHHLMLVLKPDIAIGLGLPYEGPR